MIFKAIGSLIVSLACTSVATAANDFCLKDICIGDPISKHAARLQVDEQWLNSLPAPYCGGFIMPQQREHEINIEGMVYKISVSANPRSAGKARGDYYEVERIVVSFPRVTTDEVIRVGQDVVNRHKAFRSSAQTNVSQTWETGRNSQPRVTLSADAMYDQFSGNGPRSALLMSAYYPERNPRNYERQPGCGRLAPKF